MALTIISKTQYQRLNFLTKHLTIITHFPTNFKSFATTQNPKSSNLSNTNHTKQTSLTNLLQRYDFPYSHISDFLSKNRFLLNSNVSDLEKCMKILLFSLKLHQNVIVLLVCNCPGVLELGFLKKWEVGFASLGGLVESKRMVCSVLEYSRRFGIDPHGFCGCVKVLRGLGVSDGSICRVLEEFPGVVMVDEREVKRRMEFWTVLGMDREHVDRVYNSCPRVLAFGVENRLKPLLEEFLEIGGGRHVVRDEIIREPGILRFELGELRWCLELLQRLRCRESIKEKIFSEGEFKAAFAVKLRVECLCRYGLIRKDALNVLKREPRSMVYSLVDMERKVQFLLERMKFGVDSLVEVPEYLGVNFDKQIVPRYNVIEYLRSRGGLGFEIGLRDIIKPSRLRFYNLYVKPYPECEKMYGRFSECVETKSRHPIGLWKHFKPPKYPESKEDVNNLKSFSELLV